MEARERILYFWEPQEVVSVTEKRDTSSRIEPT